MKWVLFGVLALVVVLAGAAVMLPMSVAAGVVADRVADFKFAKASGSVWNGRLTDVRLGDQVLGDLSVQTDPLKVFSGAAAGKVGIVRGGFTGQGALSYSLTGGDLKVSDLVMTGPIREVAGLPSRIRETDGRFSLQIADIKFGKDGCEAASGEVWTDALAKVDFEGDWLGPELRGPVSCTEAGVSLNAAGQSATGEAVTAGVLIGDGFTMDLNARVAGAEGGAAARLMEAGFLPENGALVLRGRIGG